MVYTQHYYLVVVKYVVLQNAFEIRKKKPVV